MRIGIVSDIHCNGGALRTALETMGPVGALLCLGDAISQHRFSSEVVGMLHARRAVCIQGNHEAIFLGAGGAAARAAPGIDAGLLAWLASWPSTAHECFGGRRLWMVHGTPWQADGYARADDRRFDAALGASDADILLCGHTHQPAIRRIGGKLLVNPGSVGEGRPTEQGYVRSCAIVDTEQLDAKILDFA